MMQNLVYAAPAAGLLALLFAYWRASWVRSQDAGTDEMQTIHIARGLLTDAA